MSTLQQRAKRWLLDARLKLRSVVGKRAVYPMVCIILLIWLAGCSQYGTYGVIGIAYKLDNELIGPNPGAVIEIHQPVSENSEIVWGHFSQYRSGFPFNDDFVQELNYISWEYQIK